MNYAMFYKLEFLWLALSSGWLAVTCHAFVQERRGLLGRTTCFVPLQNSNNPSSSSSSSSSDGSSFSVNGENGADGVKREIVNGQHQVQQQFISENSTDLHPKKTSDDHIELLIHNQLLLQRVTQLEDLVSKQSLDIQRLQKECTVLAEASAAFGRIVELLKASELSSNLIPSALQDDDSNSGKKKNQQDKSVVEKDANNRLIDPAISLDQDSEIFGKAPSSVTEAADAAGSSILSALLAGQQRLLVDVRDAELTSNAETLVQLIELAILPVAAGLEGLESKRNRLKLVFPTVKQLLQYRKTMALAAPEVVALSTLGLDPVDDRDNLVVIVAPAPDDEEGYHVMNALLQPSNDTKMIRQPIVVLNPHMTPIQGPAADFEVAYHLRLLSVQYTASQQRPGTNFIQRGDLKKARKQNKLDGIIGSASKVDAYSDGSKAPLDENTKTNQSSDDNDAALEAAMRHAKQVTGFGSGTTRAMVIRGYPHPWHVFVDTSPDTDADFCIAGTFEAAPSLEEIQLSIIECLEGSEEQDNLVAQQMQQALEMGQLDRVSEILSEIMGYDDMADDEGEDHLDDPWGLSDVDSV